MTIIYRVVEPRCPPRPLFFMNMISRPAPTVQTPPPPPTTPPPPIPLIVVTSPRHQSRSYPAEATYGPLMTPREQTMYDIMSRGEQRCYQPYCDFCRLKFGLAEEPPPPTTLDILFSCCRCTKNEDQ